MLCDVLIFRITANGLLMLMNIRVICAPIKFAYLLYLLTYYFSLRRRLSELILFQRVETCLK